MNIDASCDRAFRPLVDFKFGQAYTYAGVRIVVTSDDGSVIDDLNNYLPESSAIGAGAAYEISHSVDQVAEVAIREFCSQGSEIQAKEDLFYRVRRFREFVCYASSFGSLDDLHVLVKRGRRISVICAGDSEAAIRTPLRIFRELLLRHLENNGAILVHAAAAKLPDGRGVLLVGNARAGKTSTMCQLILNNGAEYISGDRCVIYPVNDEVRCIGWPFAVRVGVGFIKESRIIDSLDLSCLRRSQVPDILNDSNRDVGADTWGSTSKVELTPREFCQVFRCNHAESAPIKVIVFPRLTPDGTPMMVCDVGDESFLTLDESIYEPLDPDFLRGWLGLRAISDEDILKNSNLIKEKLRSVKSLCVIGDPRNGGLPAEFLDWR
ncbi:hypothetical protein [Burkholderia ambifaria]|uniref:hypothetical protein n=1 Tax=Burkholderia ambifaria TaxID=152480 RepID=UPI000F80EDE8|nr:hypothetical protein [Burkholderia ambifaria]